MENRVKAGGYVLKQKGGIMRKVQWGTAVLLAIYMCILAYVCFFSEGYGRTAVDGYHYNLIPFREIMRFYTYREYVGFSAFMLNLFGNVLAFAPFGFAVPVLSRMNRRFVNVAWLTFILSLTIELLQLMLKVGSFDVDDLLLNTLGGMIGYGVFFAVNHIRRKCFAR